MALAAATVSGTCSCRQSGVLTRVTRFLSFGVAAADEQRLVWKSRVFKLRRLWSRLPSSFIIEVVLGIDPHV